MATSISMAKSAAQAKEPSLSGIKRSRFSFHFNTARTRRWLLVQLVTAPAIEEEDNTATRYYNLRSHATQPSLSRVMQDYYNSSTLKRLV